MRYIAEVYFTEVDFTEVEVFSFFFPGRGRDYGVKVGSPVEEFVNGLEPTLIDGEEYYILPGNDPEEVETTLNDFIEEKVLAETNKLRLRF